MPKISVIIAIYNVEKSLYRCVNSVLCQTFADFEILLIDDGSSDKSGCICDKCAMEDKRVRVFHKKNGGVASARQIGIENAVGEYSIHIDSDDWIEPTMLKEMYEYARMNNADIVYADYYMDFGDKVILNRQTKQNSCEEFIKKMLCGYIHSAMWNKLIKHSLYKKYNVSFPNGVDYREDMCVNIKILLHNVKIAYLPIAFYHYVYNKNSLTLKNKDNKNYEEQIRCANYLSTILPMQYEEFLNTLKLNIKSDILLFYKYNRNELYFLWANLNNSICKSECGFNRKILLWCFKKKLWMMVGAMTRLYSIYRKIR